MKKKAEKPTRAMLVRVDLDDYLALRTLGETGFYGGGTPEAAAAALVERGIYALRVADARRRKEPIP